MTDPIADMLSRIRNAQKAAKAEVMVPHSKLKRRLAEILVAEGYISEFQETKGESGFTELVLKLKYDLKRPMIQSIRRVSKPGSRVYVPVQKLPHVYDNLGIAIISTSRGLMTNRQARKEKLGGEVICEIF